MHEHSVQSLVSRCGSGLNLLSFCRLSSVRVSFARDEVLRSLNGNLLPMYLDVSCIRPGCVISRMNRARIVRLSDQDPVLCTNSECC